VGIEPTNLSVNSRLLYQLSYPGLETSQRNSALTSPMISRWVMDDAQLIPGQPGGCFERRMLGSGTAW
jgi:hypothetical protein